MKMIYILILLVLLTGCGQEQEISYKQISQEKAKEMMADEAALILDVRRQDEFDEGHIPGAVLLPVESIDEASAAAVIPGKDTVVLVYCRSGNRSKTASQALAELGYINIHEFGGINTWPYEIVK